MRKLSAFLGACMVLVAVFVFCSEDGDTGTNIPPTGMMNYAVADWGTVLPAWPPFLPDTLIITFSIAADSTYEIILLDPPEKPLFSHAGTWTASGNTIYLAGTECAALDTTADPDTLKPMADSLCSIPVAIEMDIDTTTAPWTWVLTVGDLGPAIDAFPVDSGMKAAISNMELTLLKQ